MAVIYDIKTGKVVSEADDIREIEYAKRASYDQALVKLRLEARFGPNNPRFGVIIKNPITKGPFNLVFIDSYGRGNTHNSKWQYKGRNHNRPMPFPCDIHAIERCLQKEKRVTLGHKSDPFMWMDIKYGTTKEVLRLAAKYQNRLDIETMSDLVAHEDYISLLQQCNLYRIVLNLGSGNAEQERYDSPGAPSIARRLKAAEMLEAAGIQVEYRVRGRLQKNLEGVA